MMILENKVADAVQINWLGDGKRLHFQHGPIDLIVEANGTADAVHRAYHQAAAAFPQVLPDLTKELDQLRSPITGKSLPPAGVVAGFMHDAACLHAARHFVTPMIAVAGSVADYILQKLLCDQPLDRAYVNNGGDIAVFLGEGQTFTIGVCENSDVATINAKINIDSGSGLGGIATSGWRGRSHSLGIADAVTVIAASAAQADVAATLIANAVDVPGSTRVVRMPANELSPDSDLKDKSVTVEVNTLNSAEVDAALKSGGRLATQMLSDGLIGGVYISLQGKTVVLGAGISQTSCYKLAPGKLMPGRSSCSEKNLTGASYA